MPEQCAIIFGASGQDGFYLNKLLLAEGIKVYCVSRSSLDEGMKGDVSSYAYVEGLVKNISPTYIFHFAATSAIDHAHVLENHGSICTGTINILESVKRHSSQTKVFIAGSAIQFQNSSEAINEETPFEVSCQYTLARMQSVLAGRLYRDKFDLKVYIGYLFHHDSPLRSERHLSQKIVQFIKNLKDNKLERLKIGDTSLEKEFNHAFDIITAIWILVNQEKVSEIVIGSGKPYAISHWLDCCFMLVGLDWKNFVDEDHSYTSSFKKIYSDPRLLVSLGWKPKYSIYNLAEMMLNKDENESKK